MSNIPLARSLLADLADELGQAGSPWAAERINAIAAAHLLRKSPIRKAGPSSQPMTSALAQAIRSHAEQHPEPRSPRSPPSMA